jgi:hypothetical protein
VLPRNSFVVNCSAQLLAANAVRSDLASYLPLQQLNLCGLVAPQYAREAELQRAPIAEGFLLSRLWLAAPRDQAFRGVLQQSALRELEATDESWLLKVIITRGTVVLLHLGGNGSYRFGRKLAARINQRDA